MIACERRMNRKNVVRNPRTYIKFIFKVLKRGFRVHPDIYLLARLAFQNERPVIRDNESLEYR